MTLLPRLWLGSNKTTPPFNSEVRHRDVASRESQEKRECKILFKPDITFLYNGGLLQSFSLPSEPKGYNTHENYASALQMLITILYSLIRDDICWKEQVADSHWALPWNAGIKGSPASYLALEIGQPAGCNVPGSGFSDMEVHIAVPSLVLLCWDRAQMQILASPLPSFLPHSAMEPFTVSVDCQDSRGGVRRWLSRSSALPVHCWEKLGRGKGLSLSQFKQRSPIWYLMQNLG